MSGPHGGPIELDVTAAFEDAVDDDLCEVVVVEEGAPPFERLVGCEDHRAALEVSLVDDVEEDVRRVVTDCEVADLVDDEDVGRGVAGKRLLEAALVVCGGGEVVDEGGARREERVEAVLYGSIGDCDSEVCLPRPVLPERMRERPSATKSGLRKEPKTAMRRVDCMVKLKPSAVLKKGSSALTRRRSTRVFARWAISSTTRVLMRCS